MEWIKVSDLLPPDMEYVLITVKHWNNGNTHVWPTQARRRNGHFEVYLDDGYAVGWDSSRVLDSEVTHWMPLPKAAED